MPETSSKKTPNRTPSDDPLAISRIGLNFDSTYFGIRSVDSTSNTGSTLLSTLLPGLHFYWDLEWNDRLKTISSFSYTRYQITQFDEYKTLQNTEGTRLGYQLEVLYRFIGQLKITSAFNAREELFNQSVNTSTIRIDKVPIMGFNLGLDYQWFKYRGITLNQSIYSAYFLPRATAEYMINSGTGYGAGIQLCHYFDRAERKKIFIKLDYRKHKQDTSIITNTDDELTLGLGIELMLNED